MFHIVIFKFIIKYILKVKIVFYGQVPSRGESTTTAYALWGQFATTLSNASQVAKLATTICIWPQPATDNGIRGDRSNWLAVSQGHI